MPNRDQDRALDAYAAISNVRESDRKEFKSAAKKLPATIQSCGLLQTFAFYQKDKKKDVRDIVESWLVGRPEFRHDFEENEKNGIVKSLAKLTMERYRIVRAEAIEYATWLKRATESWSS